MTAIKGKSIRSIVSEILSGSTEDILFTNKECPHSHKPKPHILRRIQNIEKGKNLISGPKAEKLFKQLVRAAKVKS